MSNGQQTCVYCGQAPGDTVDEVPPCCFFKRPLPRNLIKVPACQRCNNNVHGRDDGLVRNWLMSVKDSEQHAEVQGFLEGKRRRGLQSDPRMRNEIMRSLVDAEEVTPAGLHLGKARAFNVDHPAMDLFMERIGRALTHHETGAGFVDATFEWKLAWPGVAEQIKALAAKGTKLFLGNMRDDVFRYAGVVPYPQASLWMVGFYGGPSFVIHAAPKV